MREMMSVCGCNEVALRADLRLHGQQGGIIPMLAAPLQLLLSQTRHGSELFVQSGPQLSSM